MINGFRQNLTLPVPSPGKERKFLKPFELPKKSVEAKMFSVQLFEMHGPAGRAKTTCREHS